MCICVFFYDYIVTFSSVLFSHEGGLHHQLQSLAFSLKNPLYCFE